MRNVGEYAWRIKADNELRHCLTTAWSTDDKIETVITGGMRRYLAETDGGQFRFPVLRGMPAVLRFLLEPTVEEAEAVRADAEALVAYYEGLYDDKDPQAMSIAAALESGDHASLVLAIYIELRDDGASHACCELASALGQALEDLTTPVPAPAKSERRLKAIAKAASPAARKKAG